MVTTESWIGVRAYRGGVRLHDVVVAPHDAMAACCCALQAPSEKRRCGTSRPRTAPGSTVSFRDPTMSGSTGLSPHSHSYDPTNPLLRYSGASQVEQARLLVPPPHSGSVAACSVHTVVSLQVDPSGQASQHAAATQWRSFSAQHTVP